MNYLGELSKARPRGKSDDLLMSEISRCDSELALVRDDLVRSSCEALAECSRLMIAFLVLTERDRPPADESADRDRPRP